MPSLSAISFVFFDHGRALPDFIRVMVRVRVGVRVRVRVGVRVTIRVTVRARVRARVRVAAGPRRPVRMSRPARRLAG